MSHTFKPFVATLALVSLVLVSLVIVLGSAQTAAATGNYCGVVASTSGEQVATGYWYTAENGRRYCREIGDPAIFVCMDANGRLPTTTSQRTVVYSVRSLVTYTFDEVIKRPVPDASPFKPSGTYDPYAVNVGSLSRPVWQSSGARPTPEEQAAWDAQFSPEIVAIYDDDAMNGLYTEPPPGLPTMDGWTYRRRQVTVPGGTYETRTRTVDVVSTALSHNGDGTCTPDAAEHGRVLYDTLPRSRPSEWADHTPTVGDGVNEHHPGSFGDATFQRHAATGAISTHSDGTNVAHNRFVHVCVSDGMVMTSSVRCASRTPDPPETTPTIHTCYAQNYVTEPRMSDWDPIITKPDGPPVPYTSTSPCP